MSIYGIVPISISFIYSYEYYVHTNGICFYSIIWAYISYMDISCMYIFANGASQSEMWKDKVQNVVCYRDGQLMNPLLSRARVKTENCK